LYRNVVSLALLPVSAEGRHTPSVRPAGSRGARRVLLSCTVRRLQLPFQMSLRNADRVCRPGLLAFGHLSLPYRLGISRSEDRIRSCSSA